MSTEHTGIGRSDANNVCLTSGKRREEWGEPKRDSFDGVIDIGGMTARVCPPLAPDHAQPVGYGVERMSRHGEER